MPNMNIMAGTPYVYYNGTLPSNAFTKISFSKYTRTIIVGRCAEISYLSFDGGTTYLVIPATTVLTVPTRVRECWVEAAANTPVYSLYAELEST